MNKKTTRDAKPNLCELCDYIFDATKEEIERKKTQNEPPHFLPDVYILSVSSSIKAVCSNCLSKAKYEVCLGDGKIEAVFKTT